VAVNNRKGVLASTGCTSMGCTTAICTINDSLYLCKPERRSLGWAGTVMMADMPM
jgi:hypothetical protein